MPAGPPPTMQQFTLVSVIHGKADISVRPNYSGISLSFKDLKVKLPTLVVDQRMLLLIYVSAALVVTIQRGVFGFPNDFAIFRASFWNLLANKDLYVLRLDQARDYFKYSPSFPLLFDPFDALQFVAGLYVWPLVNAQPPSLAQ